MASSPDPLCAIVHVRATVPVAGRSGSHVSVWVMVEKSLLMSEEEIVSQERKQSPNGRIWREQMLQSSVVCS